MREGRHEGRAAWGGRKLQAGAATRCSPRWLGVRAPPPTFGRLQHGSQRGSYGVCPNRVAGPVTRSQHSLCDACHEYVEPLEPGHARHRIRGGRRHRDAQRRVSFEARSSERRSTSRSSVTPLPWQWRTNPSSPPSAAAATPTELPRCCSGARTRGPRRAHSSSFRTLRSAREAPATGGAKVQRSGRDSNPRTLAGQRFSRPSPSSTRPPLRIDRRTRGTLHDPRGEVAESGRKRLPAKKVRGVELLRGFKSHPLRQFFGHAPVRTPGRVGHHGTRFHPTFGRLAAGGDLTSQGAYPFVGLAP